MKAKPAKVTEVATETIDARLLLRVLSDFRKGDFTTRLPTEQTGLTGKLYDAMNEVIDMNERMAKEFDRVANVVGKEGRIKQRASLSLATGSWAACIDSINTLIADLVQPTTEVARVIGAVAKGDLSQTMALEIEGRPLTGEFLRTAKIVNTMVDQLSTFASEVTRVAREVGTEGKLGGQAQVKGVAGTWKDLTDNVNFMANNLTNQVRNIAEVTTAVARGDLSKKITVDVKGEILELKNTINTMVDQLSTFASEVTRVAREVGTEGKLGGQADVQGVSGTWKDLTDNVNSMASNLTSQVRNIAEGDDGRCQRRPFQEDHGRRERRNSRAQKHHQHDGGSALLLRLGSDSRRERSRYRRKTRRSGRSERRLRYLERSDRQRELHGLAT